MEINQTSSLKDLTQALYGTWELSTDENEGWKCIEMGKLRIFKKVCQAGSNVLPQKFLNERTEVTPVLEFRKNNVTGQTLTLQQNAIKIDEAAVVVIIQF